MVAPGLNYDCFEAPSFRSRTKDQPELAAAVEKHVRAHFDSFEQLNDDLRVGELTFAGQRFGFIVLKIGPSRLTMQQIWNAETETMDLASLERAQRSRRKK